jgi:pimeloyl-ACP methyl ester carboxylesterase
VAECAGLRLVGCRNREGDRAVQIAEPASTLTSPHRFRTRYDVTRVVDEPGDWFVSAELLVPTSASGSDHVTVLCCTPGGGCTGEYFDLGEPDAGFSFAQYALAAGFACVLIDNLGTGRSTPGADPWISPQSVARAGAEAFALATRDLAAALPARTTIATVGVGHSMGAMLTLMGQAMGGQHSAIAILGFTPAGLPNMLSPEELRVAPEGPVPLEALTSIARQIFSGAADASGQERAIESFPFNLPDADPAGLAALGAAATNLLPLPGALSLLPGNISEYIRQITVPVFLGGGDHEPWHQAAELVPAFQSSADITFYTLVDAAHNHNVAATRELLWRRLLGWAAVVATAHRGPTHSNEGALV